MKTRLYDLFLRLLLRLSGTDPDSLDESAWSNFKRRAGKQIEEYKRVNGIQNRIRGYHRVLAVHSSDVQVRFNLGKEYQALGHVDEAIREWKKVLEIDPHYIQAREALAQLGGPVNPMRN